MGVDSQEDLKRVWVELALNAARFHLSEQTGYIHCYLEEKEALKHDTIPLRENFAYVLALLRTKQQDNVLLAREKLNALLHFEKDGGFPEYLHAYPTPHPQTSLYSLVFLYWILRDFGPILGSELHQSLRAYMERGLHFGKRNEENLSYTQRYLLKILAKTEKPVVTKERFTLSEAIDLFMAYQIDPSLATQEPIRKIFLYWDETFSFYAGSKALYLDKEDLEGCLLDLYMAEKQKILPERLKKRAFYHLLASIIYPFEEMEPTPFYSSPKEGSGSFTLLWGDKEKPYSLYLDGKQGEVKWKVVDSSLQVEMVLSDNKEIDIAEVLLYVMKREEVNLYIAGKKATLFSLGDPITIETPEGNLSLSFQGKERYLGHQLLGNRPFQRASKGKSIFKAYDFILGLRPLEKKGQMPRIELNIDLSGLRLWSIV